MSVGDESADRRADREHDDECEKMKKMSMAEKLCP
jgi:hypothetical protein